MGTPTSIGLVHVGAVQFDPLHENAFPALSMSMQNVVVGHEMSWIAFDPSTGFVHVVRVVQFVPLYPYTVPVPPAMHWTVPLTHVTGKKEPDKLRDHEVPL